MTAAALAHFDATMRAAGLDPVQVESIIAAALAEDLRDGPDVTTTATVPAEAIGTATISARQPGILAGGTVALAVFDQVLGGDFEVLTLLPDGACLTAGEAALVIRGRTAGLLTAERTALNLLTHLSGIATMTRQWADAVAGTDAIIRDSRKTLPGLRSLQKYAVRCGGGVNHRMSLGDAALIKDNHVAAAGGVTAAITAVRTLAPHISMEVEVDTLDQLDEALAAEVDLVLLDNFSTADTVEAVQRTRKVRPATRLEASGGLTLDRAFEVAATGVDFLAVGGLTHSVTALDLGLELS